MLYEGKSVCEVYLKEWLKTGAFKFIEESRQYNPTSHSKEDELALNCGAPEAEDRWHPGRILAALIFISPSLR